jgi:TRAP-type C4-dicarboxylate transport system substrate-binding protein
MRGRYEAFAAPFRLPQAEKNRKEDLIMTLKKRVIGAGIAMVFALGLLSGGLVFPKAAKAVELTFQNFIPSVGLMAEEYRKWGDLVEKKTEGRVKIKWFWSNAMFSMTESLQSVAQGVADFGIASGAYFPTQLPTILVFEHAYNAQDLWVGNRATGNLFHKRMPELQKEYEASGVKWVCPYTSGTFQWFLKGSWKGPEDFKGKVGRTMGGARKTWFEMMGLKPVFLAITDVYEAVERGTVWGFENTLNLANDLKQYEVVNNLVGVNSGVVMSSSTIMNLKKFNSLSKKDQQAIMDAGVEWSENMMARRIYEREKELVQEWKEKRGINIIYPTKEQNEYMKGLGRKAAMELAKDQDKKLGPKGQVVKTLEALWDEVDKAEKIVETKGYPWK